MSLRKKMLVSLFAALLCVSSYVVLPIGPVPVTLQVLFVLFAGAVLGAEMGALSVVIWIMLGAFGLPVFAGVTRTMISAFRLDAAAWLVPSVP